MNLMAFQVHILNQDPAGPSMARVLNIAKGEAADKATPMRNTDPRDRLTNQLIATKFRSKFEITTIYSDYYTCVKAEVIAVRRYRLTDF